MYYWIVGLFCVGLISGCNNGSSDEDPIPDETLFSNESVDQSTNESTDESSDVKNTNYSQINCTDDLKSVLTLINELRAQEQACGSERFGPVSELNWNTVLASAAQKHSDDMANYDFFNHTGLDGSTVATRVTAQGYIWSSVAENIAAGQTTAQSVVDAWMTSDGHCKNIMSENVIEMGLACSENSDATYTYYWTQVFAKPR